MIESIYDVAYSIWNYLMTLAMTLFTTSPSAANGSVYQTTHTLYNSISAVSIPIAELFFFIAIYQDVVGSPPEQQLRRLVMDMLKLTVMIVVLQNLWPLMGGIMEFADGLTDALSISTTYTLSMTTELKQAVMDITAEPTVTISWSTFLQDIPIFFRAWLGWAIANVLLILASAGTLIIIVASSLSILSSAFQRIIKPLVIMPFASITVAMAAGTQEAGRTSWQYLKTFFGLCISGAFMVICIKLGVSLTAGGLIAFDITTLNVYERVIFVSVQNAITPIVIAGLVKSADSLIARIF